MILGNETGAVFRATTGAVDGRKPSNRSTASKGAALHGNGLSTFWLRLMCTRLPLGHVLLSKSHFFRVSAKIWYCILRS